MKFIFQYFKKIILALLLACFLTFTGYFSWKLQKSSQIVDNLSHIPNVKIKTFNLTQYDQLGNKIYFLMGENLKYYKSQIDATADSVELKNYSLLPNNLIQENWKAKSDYASISPDKNKLTLTGNVNMLKPNLETNKMLHLTTSILYYYNLEQRVDTDQRVTINEAPSSTTGVGLIGFPKKNQFTILNEVKTNYAPMP